MDDMPAENTGKTDTAKIIYVLYLLGVVVGVTGIIGVIMAYVYKEDAPPWLQSHYRFQIRTFWIGAIYLAAGVLFSVIFLGIFILLFWVIWLAIRCIKGIKLLDEGRAHPRPASWLF